MDEKDSRLLSKLADKKKVAWLGASYKRLVELQKRGWVTECRTGPDFIWYARITEEGHKALFLSKQN